MPSALPTRPSFLRLRTLRAQALLILAVLIALTALGANRVVTHDTALTAANSAADHDRQLQLDAASLLTGMLNQETGVRGYINTAQSQFLEPYTSGRTQVTQAEASLTREVDAHLRTQLARVVDAAAAWQSWADTRVAAVTAKAAPLIDVAQSAAGKNLFDEFRSSAQTLDAGIAVALRTAQSEAQIQSSSVLAVTAGTALLVIAVLLVLAAIVYRSTLRPMTALFEAASSLAAGNPAQIPVFRSDNEVARLARALASWKQTEVERLTLVKTASELSGRIELQEILELGAERLREVLDCPYVTISEAESTGLHLVLSPDAEHLRPDFSFPTASPSGNAFRSREPVISDLRNAGWDPVVIRFQKEHAAGPSLALPLISGAELIGVVSCTRLATQPSFTSADVNRVELYSTSLASAIRVSLLFKNLKEATAKLEVANLHKSQFLANMSHELRTPLNAILGFSELLADDKAGRYDEATRSRFLGQIHSSGKHLLQLINDILDLSKVEAGQMELHIERLSIADAVQGVVATVEPLARTKEIALEANVAADMRLEADTAKLKQMLLNLVSNAIKFTPAGGRVTITASQTDSWVEIAVRDTGVGIAAADLDRLFVEFQQLDSGLGRRQEGTGLGLALTKRFAELHQGEVRVESELGKGSTFTLRFPATAALRVELPMHQADPNTMAHPEWPLVLIVEDNPQASELLARHLEAGGFRMAIARTGTEALAMARDLMPVAVTLDILLPEIDGWEVLTRLKADERTRNVPVVVVSVVDNPALGRALGALDYFVKPIDGNALLSRLAEYTFTSKVVTDDVSVLIVDDETANLDLLEALLKPEGFNVLRASGGRAGIEMAKSMRPNLILLDLMMPEVTGFDVVEAIRADESTRSIPIMVLTAKILTEEDKRALNGHVGAIFQRNSVAGEELIAWLRGVISKRKT